MYFAGSHVPPKATVDGLIVFSFACYSVGTPDIDDFSHMRNANPTEISPKPFISKLPQKLLAQGAIGFIGHVERAWDYSFVFEGVGGDVSTFQSSLEAILKGRPIVADFAELLRTSRRVVTGIEDKYHGLAFQAVERNDAARFVR